MNKIILLIFFIASFTRAQQSEIFNLVLHPQIRGAACLDGSPPGLYINEGSGQNKNKFMIYFDSGGFCGAGSLEDTLQSCYQRSFSSLGSTTNYKLQKNFNNQGLLSPLKQVNPVFFDWTKIFIIYCDGSEYLGHRQTSIQYKGKKLFFRGTKNVMEQFRYLDQKHDFYNSDMIVVTGVSAGGMATYQWSNYLLENTKRAKVLALPDSGFFITDYYSEIAQQKIIRTAGTNLLNLINNEEYIPEPVQLCTKKSDFDIIDCLNSGNYIQYLKAPMFIIESAYDQWSINNLLAARCLKNTKQPYSLQSCSERYMTVIEKYRSATIQSLNIMRKYKPLLSLWSPSCVQHGFSDSLSFYNKNYKVGGLTLAEAIQKFIEDPEKPVWLIDDEGWPSNQGCSGLNKQLKFEYE